MSAISRTVLREQVKDILLQRIVSGELKPGERLVETRIARSSARARRPSARRCAISSCCGSSSPSRSAAPACASSATRADRGVPGAGRAGGARRKGGGEAPRRRRRRARARGRGDARPRRKRGDINALVEHDFAFHRLIVEAADKEILKQCWKSLGVEGRITLSLYGTYVEPTEAAELHVPILEAIRSRKPGPRAARHASTSSTSRASPASREARRGREPLTARRLTRVGAHVGWGPARGASRPISLLTDAFGYRRALIRPPCLAHAFPAAHP